MMFDTKQLYISSLYPVEKLNTAEYVSAPIPFSLPNETISFVARVSLTDIVNTLPPSDVQLILNIPHLPSTTSILADTKVTNECKVKNLTMRLP